MHRTDAENNVAGQFTDDFEGTLAGTVVDQDWLNAVQEEIITVLTLAGMAPVKADHDQLARAIALLISASASAHANLTNPHSATSAATASRLMLRDAAGRSKVVAPVAADDIAQLATVTDHAAVAATEVVSSHLKVAAAADMTTDNDAKAVTPKKLRLGLSVSLAANGYVALPTWLGGLIFQWGSFSTNASGVIGTPQLVAFPMAFPTAVVYVGSSPDQTATASPNPEFAALDWVTAGKTIATQFGVYSNYIGICKYFAVGY